jgi:hypothetical protein
MRGSLKTFGIDQPGLFYSFNIEFPGRHFVKTASIHNITRAANTDWLTANVDGENGVSITLEKIMMQKRIALVGQIQPFNDWRRTGIPSLSLAAGATLNSIPQRFPYSQDESIYNPDNVPVIADIAQKVWWAQ